MLLLCQCVVDFGGQQTFIFVKSAAASFLCLSHTLKRAVGQVTDERNIM